MVCCKKLFCLDIQALKKNVFHRGMSAKNFTDFLSRVLENVLSSFFFPFVSHISRTSSFFSQARLCSCFCVPLFLSQAPSFFPKTLGTDHKIRSQ